MAWGQKQGASRMNDIAELEARIASAMGRIGQALQAAPMGGGVQAEEVEALRLAAEAAASEAETARARAEGAEAEAVRLKALLEAESGEVAQLQERLESMTAMKDRQQERITALEAETQALSQLRGNDRAELDALIAALEPLVKEQTNA